MRIEAVDAFFLRMPEVRPIGDGSQDALLIRVTAGGFVGWGECEASPLTTIAALVAPMSHSACRPVLDSVLGASLEGPESIALIHRNVREAGMDLLQSDHALSGIDIALWDLVAKQAGEPVWALLGDTNVPKTAYASLLFGDTPEETYEAACRIARTSFRAAKFGWGPIGCGSLREDEAQFRAAREGLGQNRTLLIDAGCVFDHSVERAASWIPLLEDLDVGWWEEPFVGGALAEYDELAAMTRVPLAGGENSHRFDYARHLVDYGGIRFLQIDAGRVGGITAARQAALYARERKIGFVNHTFTSNLALSASLQAYADAGGFAEVPVETSELARAIGGEPWSQDENGFISAPVGSGLGLEPDMGRLEPYLQEVDIHWQGRRLWPPTDGGSLGFALRP